MSGPLIDYDHPDDQDVVRPDSRASEVIRLRTRVVRLTDALENIIDLATDALNTTSVGVLPSDVERIRARAEAALLK